MTALPPTPPGLHRYRSPLSRLAYRSGWLFGQSAKLGAIRLHAVNRRVLADTPGGYQLACTHLSHLEPFLLGMICRRPIDWMTRIEFYAHPVATWFLMAFGAIPVRRQGVSANAIRTAVERLRQGRVVGICPEGGVATGAASVCRGGRVKRGVGLIAVRSGRPVIPCVILGAHDLLRIGPWLPFRRGRLWVAFGDPIHPPAGVARRAAREAVAEQVERSCRSLFADLVGRYDLDAARVTDAGRHP